MRSSAFECILTAVPKLGFYIPFRFDFVEANVWLFRMIDRKSLVLFFWKQVCFLRCPANYNF